jgi:hypothetical protein
MIPKTKEKTEMRSHGTNQLDFRLRSSKVLDGETKVLIIRCGSDRPVGAVSGGSGGMAVLMNQSFV